MGLIQAASRPILRPRYVASGAAGTGTINGSGFGTKSTPAPYRYLTWAGLTNGAAADSQFDAIEKVFGEPATFVVDNSKGFGAGGSLKMAINGPDFGDAEIFPHHEFNGFSSDYLYASHWFQYVKQTSNDASSTFSQLKSYRCSPSIGTPRDNYLNAFPKIGISLNTNSANNDDTFGGHGFYDQASGTTVSWDSDGPTKAIFSDGLVHNLEWEVRLNTVGNADGTIRMWLDGVKFLEIINMEVKTSSGQHLECVQPNPGWANNLGVNKWLAWEWQHYVDTTKARIFRINASTLAAITAGPFNLTATAWSDTSVSYANDIGAPSGYDWICIMNSSGTAQVFSA